MQAPITLGLNQLIDLSGAPSQQFRDLLNELGYTMPITGTGSPEGVIEAFQFSLYLDETGGAGAIEYRKMLTDIAGDITKGWQAV